MQLWTANQLLTSSNSWYADHVCCVSSDSADSDRAVVSLDARGIFFTDRLSNDVRDPDGLPPWASDDSRELLSWYGEEARDVARDILLSARFRDLERRTFGAFDISSISEYTGEQFSLAVWRDKHPYRSSS